MGNIITNHNHCKQIQKYNNDLTIIANNFSNKTGDMTHTFDFLYDTFKNYQYDCNLSNHFNIERIMFGSGGSNNIIIAVSDINNNNYKLILKVMPTVTEQDANQMEIKFYELFTENYILTNRTPHIVGIYHHIICTDFDNFIKNIMPEKTICPTYESRLLENITLTQVQDILCSLMELYNYKIIKDEFNIIMLERCHTSLTQILYEYFSEMKICTFETEHIVDDFIHDFRRIFFQIIFTLSIIKQDHPGFLHGDFFMRNILVNLETKNNSNDYIAYHYKNKIFYLSANGFYAKINDFDRTIMANELQTKLYDPNDPNNNLIHYNPYNSKTDLFNFFHDIYDGQNLGTNSIKSLIDEMHISYKKIQPIIDFLASFFKVDVIDRINKTNRELLDITWNIDNITILENILRTPEEYLMGDFFVGFQNLPQNINIRRHYNKNY